MTGTKEDLERELTAYPWVKGAAPLLTKPNGSCLSRGKEEVQEDLHGEKRISSVRKKPSLALI